MKGTKVQSKKHTPKEFAEAYKTLCKEMGYRISVNPAFKVRDDGTWSVVLQSAITKLPENKE